MKPIPAIPRILLGPGPSLVSARVMRALATPVLGHLDPQLLSTMDDVRDALRRTFSAPEGSTALAVSGTGTAAMETCVANLVEPGTRMVVVTNGYFGDRLAEIGQRLGGQVHRVAGEWGRAIDPAVVSQAIAEPRLSSWRSSTPKHRPASSIRSEPLRPPRARRTR